MPPTEAPAETVYDREQVLAVFRAAADPTRLAILNALTGGALNANQVFKRIDTTLSGLTAPLAMLIRAGLIEPVAKDPSKSYALTNLGRDLVNLALRVA